MGHIIPPTKKSKGNIKTAILAFVKNLISKDLYMDFKNLLNPCCKPTITIEENYICGANNGISGMLLQNVTITFPGYPNASVSGILNTLNQNAFVFDILFDNNGSWTGAVQTPWDNLIASSDIEVQLTVMGIGHVVFVSDPITITNVITCP